VYTHTRTHTHTCSYTHTHTPTHKQLAGHIINLRQLLPFISQRRFSPNWAEKEVVEEEEEEVVEEEERRRDVI